MGFRYKSLHGSVNKTVPMMVVIQGRGDMNSTCFKYFVL